MILKKFMTTAVLILTIACGSGNESEIENGSSPEGEHQSPSGQAFVIVHVRRILENCYVRVIIEEPTLPSREALEEISIAAALETGGAEVYRVLIFSPSMTPGEGDGYCSVEVRAGEVTHFSETGMEWK